MKAHIDAWAKPERQALALADRQSSSSVTGFPSRVAGTASARLGWSQS